MLTVRDVIAMYLRHSEAEGVHCREVLAVRKRTLAAFEEAYGDLPAAKCEADQLIDWVEANPNWRSDSTRRAQSGAVRACFQWALAEGKINRNPFREVRYRDAERRPRLSDDEFGKILRAADVALSRALHWLRFTGCRPSELCRAQWEDIDLEQKIWKIPFPKNKLFKPKIVSLSAEAIGLLQAMNGTGGAVFLTPTGIPWRPLSLARWFRRARQRAGVQTSATLRSIGRRFARSIATTAKPLNGTTSRSGGVRPASPEKFQVNFKGSTY